MKKGLLTKGIVFGIIVMFFGVGIQPVFADVSIESIDPEMVEITIQICNGNGANDHTVILSQEKAEELENLLNIIESKLDTAKTLEETSAIFNDTVVSLFELGVLPDDMSIEDAKQLVNGMEQNPRIIEKLERWFSKNQGFDVPLGNLLCLIAGHTDETFFIGPLLIPSLILVLIMVAPPFLLDFLFDISIGSNILRVLIPLCTVFGILNFITWQLIPFAFGHMIALGSFSGSWFPIFIPAEGWIYTIGLKGIKTWDSIYGRILGFTGIKICLSIETDLHQTHFYIGAALMVDDEMN